MWMSHQRIDAFLYVITLTTHFVLPDLIGIGFKSQQLIDQTR